MEQKASWFEAKEVNQKTFDAQNAYRQTLSDNQELNHLPNDLLTGWVNNEQASRRINAANHVFMYSMSVIIKKVSEQADFSTLFSSIKLSFFIMF